MTRTGPGKVATCGGTKWGEEKSYLYLLVFLSAFVCAPGHEHTAEEGQSAKCQNFQISHVKLE